MAKKKRHRVIDPRKARQATGGGIGWYEDIPTTVDHPSPAIPAMRIIPTTVDHPSPAIPATCPHPDGEETLDPFA